MDVDPLLVVQLHEAGDDGLVEVLLLIAHDPDAATGARESAGLLLDRVAAQVNEKPAQVRFMPKLGVLFVRASRRLIQRLLDQPEVLGASSNPSATTGIKANNLHLTG